MPRSRNTPALLEVYRRQLQKGSEKSAAQPRATPPPQGQASAPASGGSRPWVRTEGSRVQFSLSTVSLAVCIVMLGGLVLGGYAVGRHTGREAGLREALASGLSWDDPLADLRNAQPEPEVLEDLNAVTTQVRTEQARQRREQRERAPGFLDNLNYVWIEQFKTAAEAGSAQMYLRDAGIESVAVERNGKWILISSEGFDFQLPEEKADCTQLVKKIKQIGQQYLQAGGRYRFDCFVNKKLPGESW